MPLNLKSVLDRELTIVEADGNMTFLESQITAKPTDTTIEYWNSTRVPIVLTVVAPEGIAMSKIEATRVKTIAYSQGKRDSLVLSTPIVNWQDSAALQVYQQSLPIGSGGTGYDLTYNLPTPMQYYILNYLEVMATPITAYIGYSGTQLFLNAPVAIPEAAVWFVSTATKLVILSFTTTTAINISFLETQTTSNFSGKPLLWSWAFSDLTELINANPWVVGSATVSYITGKYGNGMRMTAYGGTGLLSTKATGFTAGQAYTVSLWLNVSNLTLDGINFAIGEYNKGGNIEIYANAGKIYITINNRATTTAVLQTMVLNTWYCVQLLIPTAGAMTCYIDGVDEGINLTRPTFVNTNKFQITRFQTNKTAEYGAIDSCHIFSGLLTTAELDVVRLNSVKYTYNFAVSPTVFPTGDIYTGIAPAVLCNGVAPAVSTTSWAANLLRVNYTQVVTPSKDASPVVVVNTTKNASAVKTVSLGIRTAVLV
jgi:hypothetical protein